MCKDYFEDSPFGDRAKKKALANRINTIDAYAIDGDDNHWHISCPDCDREYEFTGYFESGEKVKCSCGCEFLQGRLWVDDNNYIE